jgi:hypothetical protein
MSLPSPEAIAKYPDLREPMKGKIKIRIINIQQ